MGEYLDSNKSIRIARTLGLGHDAGSDHKSESIIGGRDDKIQASPEVNNGNLELKDKLRKEIEIEISKKYESMYAKKLKDINEKEISYKNACDSLVKLLTSVKKVSEENLSVSLKNLNSITAMLVIESLYKIIGDNEKYKEYLIKVVEDSIRSLDEAVTITGLLSQYDYDLISNEPMFVEFKKFIHVDNKLTKGQFYLDDGSSIYEAGILDRLDVLRAAFLTAVSKE